MLASQERISASRNWNSITHAMHKAAIENGKTRDWLLSNTMSRASGAELNTGGFVYLPEAGISVQGMDANTAWRNALHLVQALQMPIEVTFVWHNKDGAAHPGNRGKLFWSPD